MGGFPAASVLLYRPRSRRGRGGVASRHAAAVAPKTFGATGCHAGTIASILSPSSSALMRSTRLSHWIQQATFHPWLQLISPASTFPLGVLTVIRPSFGVWTPLGQLGRARGPKVGAEGIADVAQQQREDVDLRQGRIRRQDWNQPVRRARRSRPRCRRTARCGSGWRTRWSRGSGGTGCPRRTPCPARARPPRAAPADRRSPVGVCGVAGAGGRGGCAPASAPLRCRPVFGRRCRPCPPVSSRSCSLCVPVPPHPVRRVVVRCRRALPSSCAASSWFGVGADDGGEDRVVCGRGRDPTLRTVVDIRLPTAPRRNPFSTVSRACQTAR